MGKKEVNKLPETVNVSQLAEIMDLTDRRVQILAKANVFQKVAHGKYALKGAGRAYADYIAKSEVDRRDGGTSRDDLLFEQARKLRLENEQTEGALISTDLAIAAIDKILGVVQSELAGLPAQASDDVVVRRKVEDGVERILTAITERSVNAGQALEEGRDPFEAGTSDDL